MFRHRTVMVVYFIYVTHTCVWLMRLLLDCIYIVERVYENICLTEKKNEINLFIDQKRVFKVYI